MNKFIIVTFFLLIGFLSCNKSRLEPEPEASIPGEISFATEDRTLSAVRGVYSGTKVGQIYGGRYIVYQDIRGEEFLNVSNNAVTNLQTWSYGVSSSTNEVQNFWNAAYTAINRANVVIARMGESPVSEELKANYIAEARFIRALLYHSLVTIYAQPYTKSSGSDPGVVLYTEPQTQRGENNRPRATVAEVYDQILQDLNFAEENLPETYGSNLERVTRAHKNTAIALKTRIYLYMGRYADVITEADKIVPPLPPFKAPGGVPHELASNIANVFGADAQTIENILSFPFTDLDLPGTQNSLNQYFSPGGSGNTGNGDYQLNRESESIVANTEWKETDARRNFNQLTTNDKGRDFLWLRKWTSNTNFVPAIRYAEVLLNLAEALARENGNDARAMALVNAVRQRSDPSTTIVASTAEELLNKILTERRIELLGEGFRSRDLQRLGLPFPARGGQGEIPTTAAQYLWPIPDDERFVNQAAEQNPGY